MFKWLSLLFFITSNAISANVVDIDAACKEEEEQKKSLLTRMSTSLIEAHLAGQCKGFNSYSEINIDKNCSEFVEQQNAIFPSLSTSLIEANLAGRCVGAIYRIAEDCRVDLKSIDYTFVAENATSISAVRASLVCYGERYGR